MNLNILNTFLTIVEEGNFSKAANKLHLSQPAVSMQMQTLSSELGINLFLRVGKKIQLTEAGNLLYQEGKVLLGKWSDILNKLDNHKKHISGKLRLGASTIPGQYHLPKTIKIFKEQYPNGEIDILIKDSQEVIKELVEGNIDVAFIGKRMIKSNISCCKWVSDRIVLVKGKEFKCPEKLDYHKLCNYPIIMRKQSSGTQNIIDENLKLNGVKIDSLDIPLQLDSTENVVAAVEAGIGLAFISEIAAQRGVKLGTLEIVNFSGNIERDIYYAFRSDLINSNLCESFLSFLSGNGGEI